MSDLATLLGAIASLVTAIGGVAVGVLALRRASPGERQRAAAKAIQRVLGTDDDETDDDRREVIAALLAELQRQREDEP